MYIRANTGLGDPFAPLPAPARTDWRRQTMPDPPPQAQLVFRRIGPFAVDKSVMTPQLKQQVAKVVEFVRARLNTVPSIGTIRIVGHTDASGTELHNIGLGNRRSDAVRDEFRAQLRDVLNRVLIETDESPGKSQPIGDNRTAKGQAANRRVDVYVGQPIPTADPWPGKPIKWPPPPPPPPPPPEPDDPYCLLRPNRKECNFEKMRGRSLPELLTELCRKRFSADTCKTLVSKAISGGCTGVELLLEQAGVKLSEGEKKTLEAECTKWANKTRF